MNNQHDDEVRAIVDAGENVGIPVSEAHAELAAQWQDSLRASIQTVRNLEHGECEPLTVFRPEDPRIRTNAGDSQ